VSSRASLSETLQRLLPGEKNKRIREAILQAANFASSRTDGLRKQLESENRLRTGVLANGRINITSPTSADLEGFAWVVDYEIHQLIGIETLTIIAPDSNFPRPDIFVGKADGSIEYRAGSVDAEGNAQHPSYDPAIEVLLRSVIRNPDNTNDDEDTGSGTSNWVSKSATGTEVMQGNLALTPLAGGFHDYLRTDPNGKIQIARGDKAGTRATIQGSTGWARVIRINCDFSTQINYGMTLELSAVEQNDFQSAKLTFYIRFNTSGVIQDSTTLLFGRATPSRYKIVKIASNIYELWMQHFTSLTLYVWRPLFSFGSLEKYTLYDKEAITTIPAGDQLDFTEYAGDGLTLDPVIIDALQAANSPDGGNPFATIDDIPIVPEDFIELGDTPSSYTGHGIKKVVVKADESGLEFVEDGPVDSTGSVVYFDKPRTYNSPGSPNTNATLTENNTPFRKVTQVIFHQASSFNPPSSWEKSTGSDDYDPAKINVIYVEAFSATYKRYIIDHDE
jgi:hypothetical protein